MKCTHISRSLTLLLASIGVVVPQATVAFAAPSDQAIRPSVPQTAPTLADVVLTAAGKLQGQVIDRQGAPKANAPVTIATARGEVVGHVKSDRQGYFTADLSKGGVYTIATNETKVAVRVWAQAAAPPAAHEGLLVVDEPGAVLRGQDDDSGYRRRWLLLGAGGVITAGVIVAALEQNSAS